MKKLYFLSARLDIKDIRFVTESSDIIDEGINTVMIKEITGNRRSYYKNNLNDIIDQTIFNKYHNTIYFTSICFEHDLENVKKELEKALLARLNQIETTVAILRTNMQENVSKWPKI